MHAQHMIVMHGPPYWRTTLSDSAAGRGTCFHESKLIAKALELDIDAYSESLIDKVA